MSTGIALYGCGTVGSALVALLSGGRPALDGAGDATAGLELRHVVVRDPGRRRGVAPTVPLSADLDAPLEDPEVAVVVELMGGTDAALRVAVTALAAGKHVVTANKALVAVHGARLEELARRSGAELRYEAAVAAGVPVLAALAGPLRAERVVRVRGILNGTTNFVLTRMAEEGLSLEESLRRARELGFAEADPSDDLSGLDAARKLVILARHAFGPWLPVEAVERRGIEAVSAADVAAAARAGAVIKLVAEAERRDDGGISLRVAPVRVPAGSMLGTTRHEANAVLFEGEAAGPLWFAGPGAGGRATASAVRADLLAVADRHRARLQPA